MSTTYSKPNLHCWQDWVGLFARLIPGVVFLYAGATKVINIPWFIRNIEAYQLPMPNIFADILGYILPVVEIAVGLLLILGLLQRWAALVTGIMLIGFIGGIVWVWSQGINIDCGCFGSGGEVAAEDTQYPQKVLENVGMTLCCAWLVVRPRSLFSLDQFLFGSFIPADEPDSALESAEL